MRPVTDTEASTHDGARELDDVTVLLVEDDLGDQRLFSRQVQSSGLRPAVVTVGSVAAAVDVLEGEDRVDVVLLDLGLPDSEGLATLERVTATGTDVPVIILTGHGEDPELAVSALRKGAHDYLVKGETTSRELGRAIRYALERSEMQRRAAAQLLRQTALHQLEVTGRATDLQGFAQAAASAVQIGLDAQRVSVRFDGPAVPARTAATAIGDLLTAGAVDLELEDDAATSVELRGEASSFGCIDVALPEGAGLTTSEQRFLSTVAAAVTSRVERLVANLQLHTRTRQLDSVQHMAEQLQRESDPDAAVTRVAELLLEGLQGNGELGVRVEVEDHRATAGAAQRGGAVVEAPVTVRGDELGSIALFRDPDHGPDPEERTLVEGVAAQLGTWWALVHADREHRRDLDRIAQLMETAPVGLALVDTEGVVRFANATALALVGADDLEQFPWQFHEEAHDGLDPALVAVARVRATGSPVRDVRVAVDLGDGTERVLAVNASPLAPGPCGRRGMAVSISDVTLERRRAALLESALDREQRSAEELRRVSELKDGFLRALSHELRTPLASIVGFVETLKDHRDDLGPEQAQDMLHRLESNAQRLGLMLEDLLDVGRLTAGVPSRPHRVEQDLAELVASIVELLPTSDHVVKLHLEPTLALVDRPKIERVIHNLVGNAIRHTPAGTTIRITTRRESGAAVLVVDDSGPGIPVREREDVFEPFVQGEVAAASASPGTGVGLSLIRQFVELHGGSAEVDGGPLGGARFTVVLPD